ncbi:MAG: 50S ribosomal protein L9, partial [Candidatus Hydrogenedentes bacterium]|nr:50S ribosomal protein L9 [Candidatus Hydrogenedentota bacterium]
VTAANIADELKARGHEVERKKVLLDEPIKALGIYAVPVRLASGIEASVKIWVTAENPPEEETTEAPEKESE